MSKFVVTAAAVLALCVYVSEANAQSQPLGGRVVVSVNVAGQGGSDDLTRATSFTLYDEQANVSVAQTVETGGGFVDIGGWVKLTRTFGVGIAYNALGNTAGGAVSGALPHPLFFDQPRSVTATSDTLEHKHRAIHLQAVAFIPFVDKVDFHVFGGPTFFNTRQDFVRGVDFTENPPNFSTVTVTGVEEIRQEEGSVGFNIGGDVTYYVTRVVGVGAMLRYSRSKVDFDLGEGDTPSLEVGGFQIGGGVRIRF